MSTLLIEQMQETYVTLYEAAEYLRVNPLTINRWIKSGKLEAHHLWRNVLIEKAALENLKR